MTLPFTVPLSDRFATSIRSLPPLAEYEPEHLCTSDFRLYSDAKLEMFYAPFDAVNRSAKVAIVGITPGFQQMEVAFRVARAALNDTASVTDACNQAKAQASFAGTMRLNLISMFADIGLHDALGISDARMLFYSCRSLLHTTSAIRYPVFVRGANYTGYNPRPMRHPVLRDIIFEVLAPELAEVSDALIIPLGKAVDDCLSDLITSGVVSCDRCLVGFPHPSSVNGHKKRQFDQNREMLRTKAASWFAKEAVVTKE